ncbi:Os06g0162700, partial [Oryza sativa Japonica Group]
FLRNLNRKLVKLVEQFGLRKWSHIAQILPGRVGKQCRERWHNHLRPNIKVLCAPTFCLSKYCFLI